MSLLCCCVSVLEIPIAAVLILALGSVFWKAARWWRKRRARGCDVIGVCGRCYAEGVKVFPANCEEKPEQLVRALIGQYHCPDCGAMIMAGIPHFPMCKPCLDRTHPELDQKEDRNGRS